MYVHAFLWLDRGDGTGPKWHPGGALVTAISQVTSATTASNPLPRGKPVRWGPQNRIKPPLAEERPKLAEYLTQCTTKWVNDVSVLDHRLKELVSRDLEDHLRQLVRAVCDLGDRAALQRYRVREWAHIHCYRGRWTKSPDRSTTLGALHQARCDHQAARAGESADDGLAIGKWPYSASGHKSDGNAWVAETYRNARRFSWRTRWEET